MATTNVCRSTASSGALRLYTDVVLSFLGLRTEDVFA